MEQNRNKRAIRIFYFSGTGNTKMVVDLLAQAFKDNAREVDVLAIDDIFRKNLSVNITSDDTVGLIYPIYGFNAPSIIFKFLEQLPAVQHPKVFVIKSPGDPFIRGGATSMIRNRLIRKGFDVFYENYIVMPPNMAVRYADELLKQLYLAAVDKVEQVAEDVLNGRIRLEHNSWFAQFLSWSVSRLESWGAKSTGDSFKTSRACTLCNTCVNMCPMSNITREGEKLIFGKNCIFCMRCLYTCPQKAIIPHWSAKWAVLKDWYDLKKIVHDPAIKGEYVTSNSNWYFKRLYKYMNEQH